MGVHAFQVVMKGPSGLPADQYVNTWHFYSAGSGLLGPDFDNVRDMLKDFYCFTVTTKSVSNYLTSQLQTGVTVKAYDLEESKPRVPVYTGTFTLTGLGTGNPMPFEVAFCASFEGKKVSGELQSRKRNRVYLGPLANGIGWSDGKPIITAQDTVLAALKALRTASDASATWDWCTWSETDQSWHKIGHVWCDDAFDTQRRRGQAASRRSEFTYP